jgi:predicted nucleic acid-binding protein
VTFLLNTNVVSEWVKPRPDPGVIAWLAEVDEDRVFLSVVTLA